MALYFCDECGVEKVSSSHAMAHHVCFECRTKREMDARARELDVPTLDEMNASRLGLADDVVEARRKQAAADQWIEDQVARANTRMIVAELERRDRERASDDPSSGK